MKKATLSLVMILAVGAATAGQRVPTPREPHCDPKTTSGPKTPPSPPSPPSTPASPATPAKVGESHGRQGMGGTDKPCDQVQEAQPFWCKVLK